VLELGWLKKEHRLVYYPDFTIVYPDCMADGSAERLHVASRGQRLEYFTIVWNALERIADVAAGVIAGSISLTAFGIDSLSK
jgi:hypothetical protein